MTARWHVGPITGRLLLVGARHLAGDPRLPVLHDHRPEDDPDVDRRGADDLRGLGRAARRAPDRAGAAPSSGARSRCSARSRSSASRGRCSSAAGDPLSSRAPGSPRRPPSCSSATRGAIAAAGIRARSPERPPRRSRTPAGCRSSRSSPRRASRRVLDRKTARRIAGDLVADLQLQATALSRTAGRQGARTRGDRRRADPAAPGRSRRRGSHDRRARVPARPDARLARGRARPGRGDRGRDARRDAPADRRTRTSRRRWCAATAPSRSARRSSSSSDQGRWLVARVRTGRPIALVAAPKESAAMRRAAAAGFAGVRLTDVAQQVGLDFRQGAFRFGVTADAAGDDGRRRSAGSTTTTTAGSTSSSSTATRESRHRRWTGAAACRGARSSATSTGRFVNVTASTGAGLPVRGQGCVAADLNGDGHTDLFVTTALDDKLLWNNGDGTFTEGARSSGVVSFGWHSGAAVGDVNGDGRPDLFVAGYTEAHGPIPGSLGRLPDEPPRRARPALPERGQRPERPRALPRGRPAGRARPDAVRPLARRGLHRPERRRAARPLRRERRGPEPLLRQRARGRPARASASSTGPAAPGVADPNAGMGIAAGDYSAATGGPTCFVSNSRGQGHAVFRSRRRVVRERPARLRHRLRHELHRLGRLVGRPEQRREPRPRARERRDPGHEPGQGRRAGAGARERPERVRRRDRRSSGSATLPRVERPRRRRRRLRQRRPPGRRRSTPSAAS